MTTQIDLSNLDEHSLAICNEFLRSHASQIHKNHSAWLEAGEIYHVQLPGQPDITAFTFAKSLLQYTCNGDNQRYSYAVIDKVIQSCKAYPEPDVSVYLSKTTLKFPISLLGDKLIIQQKDKIIKLFALHLSDEDDELDEDDKEEEQEILRDVENEALFLQNSLHRGKALVKINSALWAIVMICAPGVTLSETVSTEEVTANKEVVSNKAPLKPRNLQESLMLGIKITKAILQQIYYRGLVHEDISSNNILVDTKEINNDRQFCITIIDLEKSKRVEWQGDFLYDLERLGECLSEICFDELNAWNGSDDFSQEIVFEYAKLIALISKEGRGVFSEELEGKLKDIEWNRQITMHDVLRGLEHIHFQLVHHHDTKDDREKHQQAISLAYDALDKIEPFYLYQHYELQGLLANINSQKEIIIANGKKLTDSESLKTYFQYLDINVLRDCPHNHEAMAASLTETCNFITSQLNKLLVISMQDKKHSVLIADYFRKLHLRNSTLDELFVFANKLNKLFGLLDKINAPSTSITKIGVFREKVSEVDFANKVAKLSQARKRLAQHGSQTTGTKRHSSFKKG